MPKDSNDVVKTEARRIAMMKFAQTKLKQADEFDKNLERMQTEIAQHMDKLAAAANRKDNARFEATIHQNEDIDAFIRLDRGGSCEINCDHMENLGHTSINILIDKVGRFSLAKPKMIHTRIEDKDKALNEFKYFSVMDSVD